MRKEGSLQALRENGFAYVWVHHGLLRFGLPLSILMTVVEVIMPRHGSSHSAANLASRAIIGLFASSLAFTIGLMTLPVKKS